MRKRNPDFHSVEKAANLWRPNIINNNSVELCTNSWFNITETIIDTDKHYELPQTAAPNNTVIYRSKKILLYPTNKQRQKLLSWMESYRLVYNRTIDYVKVYRERSWMTARNTIMNDIPYSWRANKVPEHSLVNAVRDVYKALDSLRAKKEFSWNSLAEIPLRYKKITCPRKIVKIEANTFSKKKQNTIGGGMGKIECSEDFLAYKRDSIIQYNRHTKEFYLFMPEAKLTQINTGNDTCSLDPGLRTFLTGYVTGQYNKTIDICDNPMKTVKKKIILLDRLRQINTRYTRRKYYKTYKKLNNMIDDLHWKCCNYLCSTYKTIVIGMMSTKGIVRGKTLNKNQKKLAYLLSHYTFRQRLKSKCEETGVNFVETEESYTSKTCSECGNKKENLGANKIYRCGECNNIFDRDVNGARNILIKVM